MLDRLAKLHLVLLTAGLSAFAALPAGGFAQTTEAPAADEAGTLYGRIGGYDALARFVDTAFPRVAVHPDLSHFFRGHSVDTQMRQRQLLLDYLCAASGGPCVYGGRAMPTVHEGLGVTDEHWSTFMSIIRSTAHELALPSADALVRLFDAQKGVVVLE